MAKRGRQERLRKTNSRDLPGLADLPGLEDLPGLKDLPGLEDLPDLVNISDKELADAGPRFMRNLLPGMFYFFDTVFGPLYSIFNVLFSPFKPMAKLFLATFWIHFFRTCFKASRRRPQKTESVLQQETDRYIDHLSFIIPRKHREGLLGDIIEGVAEMRSKNYNEKAVRCYVAWQLFIVFVERLKKLVGYGLVYGAVEWARGHIGKYLGN